ncbi:MAG: hypothetical protein IH975_05370 [Nitrospinae bacterium]|nr:hypothetical protein [Nitrospinota bacterium]
MARSCGCCNHAKRLDLDRDVCKGFSYTKIARKYGVSRGSVASHAENHLSHQLTTVLAKGAALEDLNLLGEIEDLLQRTKRILTKAEDRERYHLALSAIREARGVYELLSKIAFSLHQVRLTELEMEKEKSGEAERERQEAYDGHLAILTDAEFDLFEKLKLKVRDQTTELVKLDVFLPDPLPTTVPPRPVPTVELEEEEEGLEPENEGPPTEMKRTKKPKGNPNKIGTVEPTEIPGGGRGRYDDNIKRRKLLRRVGRRSVAQEGGGPLGGAAIPIPEE